MKSNIVVKFFVLIVSVFALAQSATVHAKQGEVLSGVININTATTVELGLLPGIGDAKAKLIVEARTQKPFASKEELVNVKGIGEKMMSQLSPYLTTEGPTTLKVLEEGSVTATKPVTAKAPN